MAVAPDLQRQGIGRRIVREAIAVATAWPSQSIRLDAYDSPAGAGEFYARCDFREVGRVTDPEGAAGLLRTAALRRIGLAHRTDSATGASTPWGLAARGRCSRNTGRRERSHPSGYVARAPAGWPPSGRRASKAPGSITGATSSPHPPPKSGDLSADRRTSGRCTSRRGRLRRARRCRRCRCASRATTRSSTSDPARAASCSWRQNTRSDGSSAWSRFASCTQSLNATSSSIDTVRGAARGSKPFTRGPRTTRGRRIRWSCSSSTRFRPTSWPRRCSASPSSLEQHPRPIWLILLFPELAPIIQAVTTLRLHQQTRRYHIYNSALAGPIADAVADVVGREVVS